MGRKAFRISLRKPGYRNIMRYAAPAFFMQNHKGRNREMGKLSTIALVMKNCSEYGNVLFQHNKRNHINEWKVT